MSGHIEGWHHPLSANAAHESWRLPPVFDPPDRDGTTQEESIPVSPEWGNALVVLVDQQGQVDVLAAGGLVRMHGDCIFAFAQGLA